VPIELTAEQRLQILETAAPIRKELVDELTASPEYQAMNDIDRRKALDKASADANAAAREYVLAGAGIGEGKGEEEEEEEAPPEVQAAYERYQEIPAYTGVLWDRKNNRMRMMRITESQYQHARYVSGIVDDVRSAYKMATGRTLAQRDALILYVQMSKDYRGAVLAMIQMQENPQRDWYWQAHPELEDYYKKTSAEPWGDETIMRWMEPYVEAAM